MDRFPKDFLWGSASSAYQIEGAVVEDGRGATIWDTFTKVPGNVANGDSGEIANDHYHRYVNDIEVMKQIGLKSYRFSFAWTRLFPSGEGEPESRGFAFYDRLIDSLLGAGIEPLATLYHWDLPQELQNQGGWINREIVKKFASYAESVAKHFGDRVKSFSPINEPWVVAWMGHGLGVHAPGIKNRRDAWGVAHHTVLAHAAAVNAMSGVRSDLKIGPVLNQAQYIPDNPNSSEQLHSADVLDAIQNRFWMNAFLDGYYPEILLAEFGHEITPWVKSGDMESAVVKNDFIGINFYFNNRVGDEVPNQVPVSNIPELFNLKINESPRGPLTDMGWPLTPNGLRDLLIRWHNEYGTKLPALYITENGCAYKDGPEDTGRINDLDRINYLRTHLSAIAQAISAGSPVKGYYHWTLMDNFEWSLGYEKRFGIVHVDFETQKRTIKDSGLWYSEIIRNNGNSI